MYKIIKNDTILWDLFTKKEEYKQQNLDKHGRFQYKNSQHKNNTIPKISYHLKKEGLKINYPDNKEFAICLSHDVDDIYPPIHHTFLSAQYYLKTKNIDQLKSHLFHRKEKNNKNPYWNISKIIKLEQKFDATSTFFFLSNSKDVSRFRYNLEDLTEIFPEIINNNDEIGLHGGYYTYNDSASLLKERKTLEKYVGKKIYGIRNHYLRFETPTTWKAQIKAGFYYDSTFSYSEMFGFKNGLCHPFKPYDLDQEKELTITEIPLNLMDTTLSQLNLSPSQYWAITEPLLKIVKKLNGVFTVNFHNQIFSNPLNKESLKLYEKILEYGNKENALLTNCKKIYDIFSSINYE